MPMILDDAAHDRHHGHGGHRHQPVPVQGRDGHCGQAHSRRTKTACASPNWTSRATAKRCGDTPAADGLLARGPQATRGELRSVGACSRWAILRCVPAAGRGNSYNEDLLYKTLRRQRRAAHRPCVGLGADARSPTSRRISRESSSLGSGQVLACPYSFEKARLIVKEMTDLLVLEIVDKGLATNQMALHIVYDL